MRAALISSLRGGASAFIEYVGLDSPLDVMIDELVERYCVTATHDTLVCEFHQLSQERNERIREFAGRIEKVFKKLQCQIPERYPDKLLLKDRLFHGMSQHLKDSLHYLYTQPSVTYANLLQAAYAAEVEAEKGRAAHSKAANLASSPDKVDIRSRDPSPIVASVAAIEYKLDKCLKTVSKVAQDPTNKTESSGSQISTISKSMAKLLGLKIKSLKNILDIEGTGEIKVKYQGYVEAIFELKEVKNLNEPCLFVVVNDSEYGKRVPIQIRTLHIDLVLERATKQELAALGKAWERGKFNRPKGREREFSLEQVDGVVKTAEAITIQPRETKKISGIAPFAGHSKRINVKE